MKKIFFALFTFCFFNLYSQVAFQGNEGQGWASVISSSGVYTPTPTNTTNVISSTARQCTWSRSSNVVTVLGSLDVVTTLAVATETQLTLPVASNLATAFDLNGAANASSAIATNVFVNGDNTTDRARLQFIGLSVSGEGTIYFSFQYVVK